MLKKIIVVLGSATLLTGSASTGYMITYEENNNSNLNTLNNVNTKATWSYNPMYPDVTLNVNKTSSTANAETAKNCGTHDSSQSQQFTYSINFLNYAPSKDQFINNYSIKLNGSFWYQFTLGGQNQTDSYSQEISLKSSNVSDTKFESRTGDKETADYYYSYSWSSTQLTFTIKVSVRAYKSNCSVYKHKASSNITLTSVNLVSKFDANIFQNQIIDALDDEFEFSSDTSNLISSDATYSINGEVKSNKEIITDEITARLKNSFGVDYDAWFGGDAPILSVNLQFDDTKNIVYITLKDEGSGIIKDNQFVLSNIAMPVTLNLSDDYWQLNLQQRLSITPGTIPNPSSSTNEMMIDHPEYYPENNQTYVYHNGVDVSFTAQNANEVLKVNGKEVPVYDNKYYIRLNDTKLSGENDETDTSYTVEIEKDGEVKMSINILIKSVSSYINFIWLGWNPVNDPTQSIYYEQYLLITPTINGETNPKYDATIDPETGTRIETIGVNYDFKDTFAFDPLNKYGNLIKDTSEYEPFYIAEATVVNSGVKAEIDTTNVAKVERVKINPETLEETSTREEVNVNSEAQFSSPGLWHYIIYLNDYVEQEVDINKPGPDTVSATAGRTLHQFLYIDNSADSYASFLNQPQISQNSNINDFWTTTQGKHLKFYLANDIALATNDIQALNYSQIISYWNQYVSDAIEQKMSIDPDQVNYLDLSKLQIAALKMNQKSQEGIKSEIINYVAKQINSQSPKAVYQVDYDIYVDNKLLGNVDLSAYVLPETSDDEEIKKEFNVTVKASTSSTLLENQQSFKVINNSKYDPEKVLDLSTVPFENYEYNFSDWTDAQKALFLDNYVYNNVAKYLDAYKNKNYDGEYVYGVDYAISLNGLYGQDIKTKQDINGILENFFNATQKVTLTFTVYALDDSLVLQGYNTYTITNDPFSPTPAPDEPPSPPNPNDDNGNNGNQDNNDKNNKTLIIAIVCSLLGAILLGVLLFIIIYKRRKSKRIK